MDGAKFDVLTRRLATGQSRRSFVRGLVGGGAALLAARAGSSMAAPRAKVTLCHKPGTAAEQTLVVSESAVTAHLGHGDDLGPCADATCVDGAMECAGEANFRTCDQGNWVTRPCATGTVCRQISESTILCDWPRG